MFPRSFLTQFVPARVANAIKRVDSLIWEPVEGTCQVAQTQPTLRHRRADEVREEEFAPVPEGTFCWAPKYAQSWFSVRLPARPRPSPLYLHWRDQAEATIYVDRVPYSGLDVAHERVPLPAGVETIWIESVCIRSAIWLAGEAARLEEEGSLYAPPRLFTRNDTAWTVYHDLRVLLELIEIEHAALEPLPKGLGKPLTSIVRHSPAFFRASPLLRRLCDRLDRALDIFDQQGLDALAVELRRIYADFPAEPGAPHVWLTGHAHIDLVWLWPERVGEFKAVHSWSTQVRLLQTYPEFRFGYSQPASYEAVAKHAPALMERVSGLIAEQRWDATGVAYVEGDTQIPCGEAILRCLRIGQDEFQKIRSTPASVYWLPDVFGYSGCIPQLIKGVGASGFFTTKLSWSSVNQFPHTSFVWRGPEGESVNAHVVLIHDYNEWVDLKRLREGVYHHQQLAVHPESLVPVGYGDGGGGPTEEMLERARRVSNLAGMPTTSWGNIEPFFERLDRVADQLPVVTGELMLELHRGVLTTHGALKAAYRGLERALQMLEAAHAAEGRGPIGLHYWKRASFAHFHDYLPGSSIWEVYDEAIPELESLTRQALDEARLVLGATEGVSPGWFNPLPLPRLWADGEKLYKLPPLTGASLEALETLAGEPPQADVHALRSDRVAAGFSDTGELVALAIDGHAVALTGHRTLLYHEHPSTFDAWDIDRVDLVHGQTPRLIGEPRVSRTGLEASLVMDFAYEVRCSFRVIYSVRYGEPCLRIRYEIDCAEPQVLLKSVFATRYQGSQARFGAPFGSVCRGQWPGYPREEAQWEVPGSRWAVLSDDAQYEGLCVLTEAKYGFSTRDGAIGVSLLRTPLVTEAHDHPQIRVTPDRPVYSDLGRQTIDLALSRFTPDAPAIEQPAALADLLFTPCLPFSAKPLVGRVREITGLSSVVPAWVEPVAGGEIWRFHETLGRSGAIRLHLAEGVRAVEVDLLNRPLPDAVPSRGTPEVLFGPYQVRSVFLSRE